MSLELTLRFLGVRGSIATPGMAAGGNTASVEVGAGDTRFMVTTRESRESDQFPIGEITVTMALLNHGTVTAHEGLVLCATARQRAATA